jgi:hypothetical protein
MLEDYTGRGINTRPKWMSNKPPYLSNVFFLPKSSKIGKTNIFWPILGYRKMQKFAVKNF